MSLARYCHERCVALSARDSAYAAARAMANNHIGAIMVYSRGRLAGMVTDRDLALRVVGARRASDVPLGEVMTLLPATVSIDDEPEDAMALMRDLSVRRLPVLDGDRLVGMVTVDDLLLSRDVSLDRLASVVEAQLSEAAPAKPAGAVGPTRMYRGPRRRDRSAIRHEAHALQTLRRFGNRLRHLLDVDDRELALQAFGVVAEAIVRRLNPPEAHDFAAELPFAIQERLLDLPAGPDRSIDRDSIEEEMRRRLGVSDEMATRLVARVGLALGELLSDGELTHVRDHLPKHMKPLLPGRAGLPAPEYAT